jgi:hypothetical protein
MSQNEKVERPKSKWSRFTIRRGGRAGIELGRRSTAVVAGCCSMMMGVALTFTICGAVIGVPLFAFGFLLVARGLF